MITLLAFSCIVSHNKPHRISADLPTEITNSVSPDACLPFATAVVGKAGACKTRAVPGGDPFATGFVDGAAKATALLTPIEGTGGDDGERTTRGAPPCLPFASAIADAVRGTTGVARPGPATSGGGLPWRTRAPGSPPAEVATKFATDAGGRTTRAELTCLAFAAAVGDEVTGSTEAVPTEATATDAGGRTTRAELTCLPFVTAAVGEESDLAEGEATAVCG